MDRAVAGETEPRRSPGETIVLREIWDGRIWTARPVIVVEDLPDRLMTYSPHGNRFRGPVTSDGAPLRLYADDWRLVEDEWHGPDVGSLAFPGLPYAVLLLFDPTTHDLEGFYINLQSPLARTPVGFDYVEYLLDVVIPADRSGWSWKDEPELAEAVDRGSFTAEDAARIRRWGERAATHVLARHPPFDRGWHDWRPDPTWPSPPPLPEGWDTAPIASLPRNVLGGGATRA